MKIRFSFQSQFLLAVLVALSMGALLAAPQVNGAADSLVPTLTTVPRPFTNISGAWMVRVKLSRMEAPKIEEVKKLDEGRITLSQGGNSQVILRSADGKDLFTIGFQTQFIAPDLGKPVTELEKIFVLPTVQGQHSIQIITPQGEAYYEFP